MLWCSWIEHLTSCGPTYCTRKEDTAPSLAAVEYFVATWDFHGNDYTKHMFRDFCDGLGIQNGSVESVPQRAYKEYGATGRSTLTSASARPDVPVILTGRVCG